jgi:hypothetical protein
MPEFLGCCIFCGTCILSSRKSLNRRRTLASVRQFVAASCRPTPHAYRRFAALEGPGRVLVCIPCVNWQRRCGMARAPKPYLLLDQLILFMLEPGKTPMPDQRCALRLLRSLRGGGDDWVTQTLRQQLPLPVLAMVEALPEACMEPGLLLNGLVKAWWDYNGNGAFFAHHQTAKLVRRVVKRGGE